MSTVLLVTLSINIHAQEKSLSQKVDNLFINYLTNITTQKMKKWFKQKKKVRRDDVENLIKDELISLENTPREKDILVAMKEKLMYNISSGEEFIECMGEVDNNNKTSLCLKSLKKSMQKLAVKQINFDENMVLSKVKQESLLNRASLDIQYAKKNLMCYKVDSNLTSVLKCIPKTRKYTEYEYSIAMIESLAKNNFRLEMGKETFVRLCKTTTFKILEKPVQNRGVYFDNFLYEYGSFQGINASGHYDENIVRQNKKSTLDMKKLEKYIGFYETIKSTKDKKVKSRYKVITGELEQKRRNKFGVSGNYMSVIDMDTNKTIATSTFYNDYHAKTVCGETYNGNLDQEYFVYKVFSDVEK